MSILITSFGCALVLTGLLYVLEGMASLFRMLEPVAQALRSVLGLPPPIFYAPAPRLFSFLFLCIGVVVGIYGLHLLEVI